MVLIYKKILHFKLNREIIHLIVIIKKLKKLNKYINFRINKNQNKKEVNNNNIIQIIIIK